MMLIEAKTVRTHGTPANDKEENVITQRGGHEAVCQQGRWASEGVDLVGVPRQWEKGTCANEDVGSQSGMDREIPRQLERKTKHP